MPPRLTNSSRLHERGVGPVVAGMTLAEAEQLTGTATTPQEFETFDGYCFYGQPAGVTAYTFLLVPPGEQPLRTLREGVIQYIHTGDADHVPLVEGCA